MLSAVERKQRWAFFHSKRWDVFDLFSLRASSWFRPRIVKTHVQEARDAALPAPLPLEMERFAAGYDWLNSNFAHRFLNNKCLPIMNNVLLAFLQ